MRPHLARFAEERVGAWRFVAVNAEAQPQTAAEFDVRALPTLIFFRDGVETYRFAGTANLSSIAEKLDELAGEPPAGASETAKG